jgi:hypothetical protein
MDAENSTDAQLTAWPPFAPVVDRTRRTLQP